MEAAIIMKNQRRGDVAILSVTHPILGTALEIGAHSIRIAPEQYLALTDELCMIAFLAPHLAFRIQTLARELGIPEISQYVMWQAEADRRATQQISTTRAMTPQIPQRRRPVKFMEKKETYDEGNTIDSDGRTADARGRDDTSPGRSRPKPSNDRGIAARKPRERLPDRARSQHAPQYVEPQISGIGDRRCSTGMPS
jgi:hypothetical protein